MAFEVQRTAEFSRWLDTLTTPDARAAVLTRLVRLGLGNPGDVKPVGSGVSELRIDLGPGYRVYYMRAGAQVYLVLGAGDKSTQAQDIERAITKANELRAVTKAAESVEAKKARKPK